MRINRLVLFIFFSLVLVPAQARPQKAEVSQPEVCSNQELSKAIRVIRAACNDVTCNPQLLKEIDTGVDKSTLLFALRSPHLLPVHIFFPIGETELSKAFDWPTIKKEQLDTIRFLENPGNTLIFILGRASTVGNFDKNVLISQRRAESVKSYIQNNLKVNCKAFHGAWLGETIFQWDISDAAFMNIPTRDYRASEMVLNQSVHVFAFPCANLIR